MAKFLIVEARFYDHLNDMLVAGAKAALPLRVCVKARSGDCPDEGCRLREAHECRCVPGVCRAENGVVFKVRCVEVP